MAPASARNGAGEASATGERTCAKTLPFRHSLAAMPSGLIALLDDVATIAKLAAASLDDVAGAAGKAATKAAGVVIDDTAVTPRYVIGLSPERELADHRQDRLGLDRNKLLFLLPAALLLTAFAPFLITPLLMIGGSYLAFEATEKIVEKLLHDHEHRRGAGRRHGRPRGARGAAGEGRDPHRLHPVGRDHGDRACQPRPICRCG